MKQVLFIAGSASSANFNVMRSVIHSLYGWNIKIHTLYVPTLDSRESMTEYADVIYYSVIHIKHYIMTRRYKIKNVLIWKMSEVYLKVVDIVENYIPNLNEWIIYYMSKRLIKQYDIDSVFSVCYPFFSHRVAYKLYKRFRIRWFPVWLDPYCNTAYLSARLCKHRLYAERLYMKRAPVIYSLPEVFKNHTLQEEFQYKIHTFELPLIINRKDIIEERSNSDIIYAGNVGGILRNPNSVLTVLASAIPFLPIEIVFKFYIRNPNDYESFTRASNGRIQFFNYVNKVELENILSNAMILLNIGNTKTLQMPSKVVEYISYRKPIIHFYSEDEDSSFRYLMDYPDRLFLQLKEDNIDENANLLIEYIRAQHKSISYDELMQNPLYKRSTPEFFKNDVESIENCRGMR